MQQAIASIKTALSPIYSSSEINLITEMIFESILGMNRVQFLLNKNALLSEESRAQIDAILIRLAAHEPIQYILGETDFCGHKFKVNKDVLIPRAETSELIEYILANKSNFPQQARCLDIGTGSGCIPITLKKSCTQWNVSAIDISSSALAVAQNNAKLNEVDVEFIEADILNCSELYFPHKFDVIISNPPYICELEKAEMEANVLDYEPHGALFVPNENPLLFYKAITQFATLHLAQDGWLFFEINPKFSAELCQLLAEHSFSQISILKDISAKERFVIGQLK